MSHVRQVRWGLMCVLLFCLGVISACSRQARTFEKTNAFDRFSTIDGVEMEVTDGSDTTICEVPKARIAELRALLENGVREVNPELREVQGSITVLADGQTHKFKLLYFTEDEFILLVSNNEYWQGIDRPSLLKFAAELV